MADTQADTTNDSLSQEDALIEEELVANELAAEQEIYAAEQDLAALAQQGRGFNKPSFFKYSTLFFLAVIQDLLDVLDLTGVGAIVAIVASIVLGGLIILICFATNTRHKRAQDYTESLATLFPQIQARIEGALRLTLRGARYGRKIKVLRPVVRRGLRAVNKVKRLVKRNPLGKVIVGNVLDFIPLIGIFPLSFFSIYLSYHDEKKTLEEARQMAQEVFPS